VARKERLVEPCVVHAILLWLEKEQKRDINFMGDISTTTSVKHVVRSFSLLERIKSYVRSVIRNHSNMFLKSITHTNMLGIEELKHSIGIE
jgi:hypothetical protein